MNDANIDNLFRLTPSLPDTSLFSAARGRDEGPAFDLHLREAGTPTPLGPTDLSPPPAPKLRRESDSASNSGASDRQQYDTSAPPETDDSSAAESNDIDHHKSEADEFTPSDSTHDTAAEPPTASATDERKLDAKQAAPKTASSDNSNGAPRRGGRKHAAEANASARTNGDGKAKADAALKQKNHEAESTIDGTPVKEKRADKKNGDSPKSHERDKATPVAKDGSVEKTVAVDEAAAEGKAQDVAAEIKSPVQGDQAEAHATENKHRESARATGTATNRKSDKANRGGTTRESSDKPDKSRDGTTKQDAAGDTRVDQDTSSATSPSAAKGDSQIGEGDAESENDAKTNTTRPRSAAGGRPGNAAASPIAAGVAPPLETNATSKDAAQPDGEKVLKVSGDAKEGTLATFARFERATAGGARAGERAGDARETPQVDPARFVTRVARAITTAQERGGTLHLRLSPPELGSLRLELSVKEGALTAHVETENPTARQVLLDNLPTLRDRLAEQNMRIERFDVDVRRDGTGDQPNFTAQQRHQQQQQQAPSNTDGMNNPRRAGGLETADAVAPVRHAITDTSINLVV